VAFTPAANGRMYAGLGRDTSASTAPDAIDFAFSFWPDGTWDVRERGTYRTEGAFTLGDTFKIAVEGSAVVYYRNGTVVYRSTQAPVLPLIVDTTFYSIGESIKDAVIHN
jgi:hypothetical protein